MDSTRLELHRGDITRFAEHDAATAAIVNAATRSLRGGGGVDGAIPRAGGPSILEECRRLRATTLRAGLPAGDAVATTAGRLPARWVIHTVGPVYSRDDDRSETLASCYRRSLEVARDVGARTVAFPAVSAGVYGWPLRDAARVAVHTVREATGADDPGVDVVTFVLFGDEAFEAFAAELDAH
jgi:O-acetyl-ADP-ribose deacetylase (regulator of RNase III)